MAPEENVAVVRRVIDAIERRDIDAAVGLASPDCEVNLSSSRGPESGIYRGRADTRQLFETFFEPWESLRWEVDEITELPGDRVLLVSRVRMRGHGSGVEVTADGASIWTVREGEFAAFTLYQSKAEALDAEGLTG